MNDARTSHRIVLDTHNAELAQRRVRWLSFTGAAVLLTMLAISTSLLAWHHESRKHANRIAEDLNEARVAMSRAAVSINREWTQLISTTATSMPSTRDEKKVSWVQDLQRVDEICHSLLKTLPDSGLNDSLHVTIRPLEQWSVKATAWKKQYLQLAQNAKEQYESTDRSLQELLESAEEQRGIHQLNLSVGLRSHYSKNPKPIAEIQRDCLGSTRANQFSSDITQLRLRLSQLMTIQSRDQLSDIGENLIKPLLVRLNAIGEELEESNLVQQVEEGIFGSPRLSNTKLPVGIFDLQTALVETNESRLLLIEEASTLTQNMDEERGRLSLAGVGLQNELSTNFSQRLGTAWSIMLASGVGLGLVFIVLTRKVSQDIAIQVAAIDRTANELGNEQLLLASVIASLPIPLFWKDDSGRYQGCSKEFADWLGFSSAAEVVGRTDDELPWDEATARRKIELEEKVAKTGISVKNVEVTKTRSDGTSQVVLASKTPLLSLDELTGGIVGAYMDITDRKNAEIRVNGLARIMAECPTEIYVFDMSTFELLEVNRAACLNLKLDESRIRNSRFTDYSSAPSGQNLGEFLAPIVDGRAAEIEYESVHRRADGTSYPVHIRILTIEHICQKVFVACATNLTSHKKLEQKLAQSQKLESIGQLSAGIAHEINTPMQCISGNIEFLQTCSGRLLSVVDAFQEQLTTKPEDWECRLSSIKEMMVKNRFDFVRAQIPLAIEESSKAATRVVEIVRAMKVMSHPGTKGKTETDLNTILRDASTVSRNRWKYSAEISFNLDENLPPIEALPAELSQVFLNLIVNAADAIGDKLGENTGTLGNIGIETSFDDEYVCVSICDDGCGMPEETIARAFEPFFTTKDVGKGTGQGLSISYDVIVKLHGGSIDIQSQPGEGTRFQVKLPRRAKPICLDPNQFLTFPSNIPAIAIDAE